MTVSAVNLWRMAFREARCLPLSLFGSVLFVAFAEVGLESVGRRSCWEAPDLASFRNSPACVFCGDRSERLNRNGRGRRHDIRLVGPPGSGAGGFRSKAARDASGVHAGILPPIGLNPAAGLREAQMMGIAGLTSADQAGLFGEKSQVIFYRAGDAAPEW